MEKEKVSEQKTCFVIMPISDVDGYEPNHFKRVYDHIIKPACKGAGYVPIRADDVQATNYIVIDILKKIISAEMVICDLSSRNPNVLYELGIRQAFNLPVTLIKDSRTQRVFDIQGLRDIEYDESLRIDTVENAKTLLESTLKNTSKLAKEDVNSIIQLLGITPANLPSVEISNDTSLLLNAINNIGERITRLEKFRDTVDHTASKRVRRRPLKDKNDRAIELGAMARHHQYGEGEVAFIDPDYIFISQPDGGYVVEPKDARELEIIGETDSGIIIK
jgi:hypothetical protein